MERVDVEHEVVPVPVDEYSSRRPGFFSLLHSMLGSKGTVARAAVMLQVDDSNDVLSYHDHQTEAMYYNKNATHHWLQRDVPRSSFEERHQQSGMIIIAQSKFIDDNYRVFSGQLVGNKDLDQLGD